MVISAKEYDYTAENGILKKTGELAKAYRPVCKVLIVSDTNVAPLYLQTVKNSFEESGFTVFDHIIPAGEKSKNLSEVTGIINAAVDSGLTRSDIMVALGGGVVGDVTGFASSVYMRGIDCISIPTTLLAMVDSSIGGKTGVDMPAGKNLVGAFHMPFAVIADPDVLATLPEDDFACGMAETIKTALIGDPVLFSFLEDSCDRTSLLSVIEKAAGFKIRLTDRDPLESSERVILNYGHTVGHGIELLSDYSVKHGAAVAAGMTIMTKASEKLGLCSDGISSRLEKLLNKFGLDPYLYSGYRLSSLTDAAIHDKKKHGEEYTVILLEGIGKPVISKTDICRLSEIIKAGVSK